MYYEKRASKRASNANNWSSGWTDGCKVGIRISTVLAIEPTLLLPCARCLLSSSSEVERSPVSQEAL